MKREEDVPCDLLILTTSDPTGKCYVTTTNLDGEGNLKPLMAPSIFLDLQLHQIVSMMAAITCQHPKPGLYSFQGRIQVNIPAEEEDRRRMMSRCAPLTIENLMLRGARLKDTDHIIGCAIYTGKDTKLSKNSKISTNKLSTVERYIYWHL